MQQILGVVVAHRDLLQDHAALSVHIGLRVHRVKDHVAKHVDGQRQVLVQHVRVVAGVLLGCERVQLAADRVDLLRDVHRGALGRALEQEMLQVVRGAGLRPPFVARAHRDPDPDRGRTHARHGFGDQS